MTGRRAATSAELSALREFVRAYERVWNDHDGEALGAFFSEDADLVMGAGPRMQGQASIVDWWRGYFARLDPGRRGSFSIHSARLISAQVAVIDVDSTTSGRSVEDERELPTRRARGTWVVVAAAGGWVIAALRVLPAEGETRSAPGSDR